MTIKQPKCMHWKFIFE